MAKERNRRREMSAPTPFEQARDEMFQQIIQCGVLQASPEHQIEWLDETMQYLAERYHELKREEMAELKTLGQRFCQPPKARAAGEQTPEQTPENTPVMVEA
jgi:iron-sulfur cluster repair protein YtfE (RIC family)